MEQTALELTYGTGVLGLIAWLAAAVIIANQQLGVFGPSARWPVYAALALGTTLVLTSGYALIGG